MLNKIFKIYFLLLASTFCALPLYSQESEEEEVVDYYALHMKNGIVKCDSAAKLKDSSFVKASKKLYLKAIKDFKSAEKIKDSNAGLFYHLAETQVIVCDYKGAAGNYKKAFALDSIHSTAIREHGKVLLKLGRFDEALEDFNLAIDINFQDYKAFYQRGLLKGTGRDKAPAFSDYGRAIELNHKYAPAYLERAKLYYTFKKDYVLAVNDLNRVIQLDLDNVEAYYWRAKARYAGGDYVGADEDMTRYLDDDFFNIEALLTRGASRINIEDHAGAIDDFNEVLKLDKGNYFAMMNRGVAKAGLRKYAEALKDLDTAIEMKFDYSPSYLNRALVKFANRNKKGACEDLERAAGLNNVKALPLIQQYCSDGRR